MQFDRADSLDAADPLAGLRSLFVEPAARTENAPSDSVVAYLDGNSLGRPLLSTARVLSSFVDDSWGTRLIRGWDEEWMSLPTVIGDELAGAALGAAAGQTLIGDSTTVLLYKAIRAAVAARPGRTEIVVDSDNFPTDRYLVEGIAAECALSVRWVETSRTSGLTEALLAPVLGPQTAVVVASQVAYRSGHLADVASLTRLAHDAGALVVWDLCHSVGSVPILLDDWQVDIAVGCTYKYLNGGPGSPAFLYVRSELQPELQQPIWGWLGHAAPFDMGPGYTPAPGIRSFQSGTPPVIGMLAMRDMIALIAQVGIDRIRAKSVALTEFTIALADDWLEPLGVQVASPRHSAERGSHVTLDHPRFREVVASLWKDGVIPDFRAPEGLRVGLSPLTTSFREVAEGLQAVRSELEKLRP
ncbi:kynureninase [Subtercola boreus]|uniref:Kynureninase n=1 Tax=Subtercola boreus TaxID=120213 RepID=A0A3E0WAY4_9MICO|nr:aminotransferase class V-fold PLP-dependent enzyme [Subtercola boreus]RFA19972.1 kynureninase [Subtercola boreus]RFA20101.1 kynureninase [Subtercola boreus]RFA26428.1 kynureninase [Subtercola boreus]